MTAEPVVTNGFLPAAPLLHLEPTLLGVIELGPVARLSLMGGPAVRTARDALLLVRLHRQPLGMIHLPNTVSIDDIDDVAEIARAQLGDRIATHELEFGCKGDQAACAGSALPPLPGAVAVIIPTSGRHSELGRCLASLRRAVGPDVEIIVVDNSPSAQTEALVADRQAGMPGLRYIAERRPGSSVARNRGLAETDAEFVAFTDDDVVVDEDWLPWLLAPFSEPEVAATTGLVLPLELATPAQKQFEQYAGFGKGLERRAYDLGGHSARDRLLYPYWGGVFGSGNSMAFRAGELVSAGGFDPALGAGSLALAGADIEAMSAAILRGRRLVYEPRSLCWHEHRRDDAALRRQVFNYGAGFTAILTKALLTDRRFIAALARSFPIAARLRRSAAGRSEAVATLPPELVQLQRQGMLRGPLLYRRSTSWAKRLQLGEVIDGR